MDDQDVASLVGGIAVVTILLVITWLIVTPNSGTNDDQTSSSRELASGTPAAQQQPTDQMQLCVGADKAIERRLRRAAPSIDHWQVQLHTAHKVVAGAITMGQATVIWNRTRVRARHQLAAFERAWGHLQRDGLDCPPPNGLPSQSSEQLRSCAREVAGDLRALYAARAAMDTWRRQMHAMDMVRTGRLSPSTASHPWSAMWRRGQRQIDAYHVAARAASHASGCASAATSATTAPFSTALPSSSTVPFPTAAPFSPTVPFPSAPPFSSAPPTSAPPKPSSPPATGSAPPPTPPPPPTSSAPPPTPTTTPPSSPPTSSSPPPSSAAASP